MTWKIAITGVGLAAAIGLGLVTGGTALTHPAMLKQVKPGDKIKFEPDKVNGQLTVMKLEKAKK